MDKIQINLKIIFLLLLLNFSYSIIDYNGVSVCQLNEPFGNYFNTIAYSGFLNVNSGISKSGLYYLFIGKENQKNIDELSKEELIIYINSGPTTDSTSSSVFSVCMENGVSQNGEEYNICFNEMDDYLKEYFKTTPIVNWNKNANILYIDSPLGVGLSHVADINDLPRNNRDIARQFYNSLKELSYLKSQCKDFSLFDRYFTDDLLKRSDIYLVGESMAGKHVPSIARFIITENQQSEYFYINLVGIGIINGLNDPITIMTELPSSSWNLGLINYQERMKYERMLLQLEGTYLYGKNTESKQIFQDIYEGIQNDAGEIYLYNMFKYEQILNNQKYDIIGQIYDKLFYQYLNYENFLVDSDKIQYNKYINQLKEKLSEDFIVPTVEDVEFCINNTMRVLIIQGQDDFICNNAGTLKWVESLAWADSKTFYERDLAFAYPNSKIGEWNLIKNKTEEIKEKFTENICGYGKSSPEKNVQFNIINKAGRFVTIEQSQNTYDVFNNFINNQNSFYGFQNTLVRTFEK